MNYIKNLSLGICILSVLFYVLKLLIPQKYEKQISMICGVIFSLFIASKLLNFELSSFEDGFKKYNISDDSVFAEDIIYSEIEMNIAEYISSMLDENGIIVNKINIKIYKDDDNYLILDEIILDIDDENQAKADSLIKTRIGNIKITFTSSEE